MNLDNSERCAALELLDKSIAYHDPEGKWANFKGSFTIKMETPKRPVRTTRIELDFLQQYFKSSVERGGVSTTSQWKAGQCMHWLEGSTTFTAAQAKEHGLNCERTNKMRDYYVYLYGLPMKLKDPGTKLDPKVYTKTLKGISYHCLKVTYDESVGKDTWYFYLDKTTAQLRHYQFFHDEAANDGGVSNSSYGPTPSHRQSVAYAREAFAPAKERLNALVEREIPALRATLRQAGAPWTIGESIAPYIGRLRGANRC